VRRRLNADQTVDFLGKSYPVATCGKKMVKIMHHPKKCFGVIAEAPNPFLSICTSATSLLRCNDCGVWH
jgi:hypothetical protein